MELQKINWKLFIDGTDNLTDDLFFEALSEWIPGSPEIFMDVADYQHMQDGPKIWLAGHYADYFLDDREGRYGMQSSRKRQEDGSNQDKIASSLKESFTRFSQLAGMKQFNGALKYKNNELEFLINDRAVAPNNGDTFKAVESDLKAVLDKAFSGVSYTLTHNGTDSRTRFSVQISIDSAIDLSEVAGRL